MLYIIQNASQCLKCNEILVSTSVHDFRTCQCGNLSVDGGGEYLKRNYRDGSDSFVDLSINSDTISETDSHKKLLWGTYGVNNTKDLSYKFLKDLSTEHLNAILNTQHQISETYQSAIKLILLERN